MNQVIPIGTSFDLIIDDRGPVSLDALVEATSLLQSAASRASVKFLHGHNVGQLDLTTEEIQGAVAFVETNKAHAFCVDWAMAAPVTLAGIITSFALLALLNLAKKSTEDTLNKREVHQELATNAAKYLDRFVDSLVEEINAGPAHRDDPERLSLSAQIVDDRVRIVVVPSRQHTRLS